MRLLRGAYASCPSWTRKHSCSPSHTGEFPCCPSWAESSMPWRAAFSYTASQLSSRALELISSLQETILPNTGATSLNNNDSGSSTNLQKPNKSAQRMPLEAGVCLRQQGGICNFTCAIKRKRGTTSQLLTARPSYRTQRLVTPTVLPLRWHLYFPTM